MFAIFRLWFVMFYPASVLFRFLVVVDAYEEQVAGKLRELFGIPPFFDLPDGGVGCFVVLEFDQYDRFAVGVCRDKRHVNEVFAAWQFFHGDKTACGSDVGVAHECAQRLLVVVEPGGGVLPCSVSNAWATYASSMDSVASSSWPDCLMSCTSSGRLPVLTTCSSSARTSWLGMRSV